MKCLDVNPLIYAFRPDAVDHEKYAAWLRQLADSTEPFVVPDVVLSAVIRITTNPRSFPVASKMELALAFVAALRAQPGFRAPIPGAAHWPLFVSFCNIPNVRGNDVSDAYIAALAVAQEADLVTCDKGFARFPGLRFEHPLGAHI